MKYLIVFIIIIHTLYAGEDLSFDNDFLNDLKDVSEIATKTKLNIDETPSFISVLNSAKLTKLGVDNVFEALSLIPGVQLQKESSGVPVVIFRGVEQKGEVKLMVDGVSINNAYRGSIYYYLDFPIELVKRIEVVRGSASVLYGSGAISGVINIITHAGADITHNKIFLSGQSDAYKGGTILSTKFKDLKLSVDAYYSNSDKTLKNSIDNALIDYGAGLNLQNDYFTFLARLKKSDAGMAYGLSYIPDETTGSRNNINQSIFTQLSYHTKISTNNKINLTAGYHNYKQKIEAQLATTVLGYGDYEEGSYFVNTELLSRSINNNELLFGLAYERFDVEKASLVLNDTINRDLVDPASKRNIGSVYLNDNYKAYDALSLSAGLRYDNYSDYGDSISPSFGLVYNINKKLKFKATHAHAFRAPSWTELQDNTNLDAETSKTFEFGVIFKKNVSNTFRLNFYSMQIENMIIKDETGKYAQDNKNDFLGTELEYSWIPNRNLELSLLASYIDAKDDDEENLANIANILGSASLIYQFDSGVSFGSLLKYISKTNREIEDSRADIDSNIVFDQTISYRLKEFSFNFIAKDLFNQGTYYASPKIANTDDYKYDERRFLVNASMEF